MEMGNPIIFSALGVVALLCGFPEWTLANSSKAGKDILEKILGGGIYDRDSRPDSGDPTATGTAVKVNLEIHDIERVNEVDKEFTIQMTLRMQWQDLRLAYKNFPGSNQIDYLNLPPHSQSDIWMPDVYFPEEKRSHTHDLMIPNKYIRIYPDGKVVLSSRLTMTLSCHMMYRLYPFDRQTCYIDLKSCTLPKTK